MKLFNQKIKKDRGMSYVELIVVLGIFSILSSVVLYNYGLFQDRIDIKNLSSDIALKVVESQKLSLSGKFPPPSYSITPTWKPSYGVYLSPGSDNKSFAYFVDIDNNNLFDGSASNCTGECLEKITITKGNSISSLDIIYKDATVVPLSDLTISFIRPNSVAIIKSGTAFSDSSVDHAEISVISQKGTIAKIKVYPSGRIQIN
ncbi:MAG: type II secretion system protein [Patescibacteria group bacterium]